jgi:hypothetical protein
MSALVASKEDNEVMVQVPEISICYPDSHTIQLVMCASTAQKVADNLAAQGFRAEASSRRTCEGCDHYDMVDVDAALGYCVLEPRMIEKRPGDRCSHFERSGDEES